MKTTNWQTKALTLFIVAAAALWLTTACNGDVTRHDGSACRADSSENTFERREEVLRKYEDTFKRHPYFSWVSVMDYINNDGKWATTNNSIVVHVTKKMDQSALPPEDRVPDCLEGIPVQIIEIGPFIPL